MKKVLFNKLQVSVWKIGVLMMTIAATATSASYADDLIIAKDGKTSAQIVVSVNAGKWEAQAATDLQKYIAMMTGAKPELANTEKDVEAALHTKTPIFVVGQLALKAQPSLQKELDRLKKKDPLVRADAIAVKRKGNRIYLSGSNDDSIYYAVVWLLQQWGCRWYMPTDFGECIPSKKVLSVGDINMAYAPPFEIRAYWLSWNAVGTGSKDFRHRNMMNNERIPSGHVLGKYTKDIVPPGKTIYDIPIATDATAMHVAKQVESKFAAGKRFNLGMEDGVYHLEDPLDKKLQANIWDKYFVIPSMTDNFMVFYNNVANLLLKKYPESKSLIGFLAYSNITIPPQRKWTAAKPLVAYLAPIDIDPNHGMDDPDSPPRQEYEAMMYRWAEVMQGRVVIYDYDQGMLVWRDVPNPSHFAFEQDVKHYRDAGILGIDTESRGAIGTTFLNLYLRGQLMWNPDVDVDKLLEEFYPKFYGPAAQPMQKYWSAIYDAWESTIVTEHEYFVIPSIYTPELVKQLGRYLRQAEQEITPLQVAGRKLTRNEKLYIERMDFTRKSYEIIRLYSEMTETVATKANYPKAAEIGKQGRAAQLVLANANPLFTTRVVGVAAQTEKNGAAWWPGEVAQYRELAKLVDGTKGTLIAKTPLEWMFHRDPRDTGLTSGWAYKSADLSYWNEHKKEYALRSRKNYPADQWGKLRTDLYMQAQGVRFPDAQNYIGYYWYKTKVKLSKEQLEGNTHLIFPGLFNECWLYVNGYMVAHRDFPDLWWRSNYKFEWDVDLSEVLQPGENTITLRGKTVSHFGGIFRRPFFYKLNE